MLAEINPVALPALRIAATFFLIVNIRRDRIYLSQSAPLLRSGSEHVEGDIPAVRKLRVEVILIPWFFLTTGSS